MPLNPYFVYLSYHQYSFIVLSSLIIRIIVSNTKIILNKDIFSNKNNYIRSLLRHVFAVKKTPMETKKFMHTYNKIN
jgi:hypothetical protein